MEKSLKGEVVKIRYYNEYDGWSVIEIAPEGNGLQAQAGADPVTVVGNMFKLLVGESAEFRGQWVEHWEYGRQLEANQILPIDPRTIPGIIKYLSSGMIKGIGEKRANAIARRFGEDAIRILDSDPKRVYEITEIPERIAKQLVDEWQINRIKRRMMTYLQGLGINATLAQDIFKKYGKNSQETIERNPFLLDEEFVYAIGFEQVDQIARNRGIDAHDKYRLWTGIEHTLHLLSRNGHTCAPKEDLINGASKLLRVDRAQVEKIMDLQLQTGDLVDDLLPVERSGSSCNAFYLPPMYLAESGAADLLKELKKCSSPLLDEMSNDRWWFLLQQLSEEHGLKLSLEQQDAVGMALRNKLSILTGGPGTGKTTVLRLLVEVLLKTDHRFALAAPTGRAAKQLTEKTKQAASTIHRLLGYEPQEEQFRSNQDNPLPFDIVVIDETSMLDLKLFYSLLQALKPSAHLLLVGDPDQLPSVGAGNVLRDVIDSDIAPVTRLTKIHRQEAGSQFAHIAQQMKEGTKLKLTNDSDDFFVFDKFTPWQASENIVELVTVKLKQKFGFDPMQHVQVLAPKYAGDCGIDMLNERLRNALLDTKHKEFVKIAGRSFCVGDKVMQTKNNYDLGVHNGDMGFIDDINIEDKFLEVWIDDRTVRYDFGAALALTHAYCISIHKSQGSEYPAVVVPVVMQQGRMLRRNLLYTAITRAREVLVLVGSRQAIWTAAGNDQVDERYSGLLARLQA